MLSKNVVIFCYCLKFATLHWNFIGNLQSAVKSAPTIFWRYSNVKKLFTYATGSNDWYEVMLYQ